LPVATLAGHTQIVLNLAFSRDGRRLATGSDNEWKLWDARTFKELRSVRAPAGWLAFGPDDATLLTGRHDHQANTVHTVHRWEVASGKELAKVDLVNRGGWAAYAASADGKLLYSRTWDDPSRLVRVHDAVTGKELFRERGHRDAIGAVAVSPDGRTLASAGSDRLVRLWDLAGWRSRRDSPPVRALDRHTAWVGSVAFSPDGRLLASGGGDGTILLWDVASGQAVRTLEGHWWAASSIAFSPDGRTVAAGGKAGNVLRWDVATGKPHGKLAWHKGPVAAVAFSPVPLPAETAPQGAQPPRWLLASAGEDRTVQLGDAAAGRILHTFPTRSPAKSVAFTHDGRTLVCITEDKVAGLLLWEVARRRQVPSRGPTGHLHGLAVHPRSRLVATGSCDGTVRWWDHVSGATRVRTFGPWGLSRRVGYHLAFTPDGRHVVTGGMWGDLYLLGVPGGAVPAGDILPGLARAAEPHRAGAAPQPGRRPAARGHSARPARPGRRR
jgi:WD40 repeat protein